MSDETLISQLKILLEKRELRLITLDQYIEALIKLFKK